MLVLVVLASAIFLHRVKAEGSEESEKYREIADDVVECLKLAKSAESEEQRPKEHRSIKECLNLAKLADSKPESFTGVPNSRYFGYQMSSDNATMPVG